MHLFHLFAVLLLLFMTSIVIFATDYPTGQPSSMPSITPSESPSSQPTNIPSRQPSSRPSRQPTMQPSRRPSRQPSTSPSSQPSRQPSTTPSRQPSRQPTHRPSNQPSLQPTQQPTGQPSRHPSMQPSRQPSSRPTMQPSIQPTAQPSSQPSSLPSMQPSIQPSSHPTCQPSSQPSTQPSYLPDFGYVNISFKADSVVNKTTTVIVTILLAEKKQNLVYCGAFPLINGTIRTVPKFVSDVIKQGFVVTAQLTQVTVTIDNLIPSTDYTIFCLSSSLTGNIIMPIEQVLQQNLTVKTACCKTATVTLLQNTLYGVYSYHDNAIQLSLDYAPTWRLIASLLATRNESIVGVMPNQVIITATANPLTTTAYTIYARGVSGSAMITAVLSGLSASEYKVVYTSTSGRTLTVLNTTIDHKQTFAAPLLQSATFSNDGASIVVRFDQDTNRARYINYFPCAALFNFTDRDLCTCRWQDSATIMIIPSIVPYVTTYYDITAAVTPYTALLPGLNITLRYNPAHPLRIVCSSLLNCSNANHTASTSITVHTAVNPIKPTVIINAPTTISACSDLYIDVSQSTGAGGGRNWTAYNFQVTNSRSFAVEALEDYLNSAAYTLIPSMAISKSMLLPASSYDFRLQLCNFMKVCSVSSVTVAIGEVSNNTSLALSLQIIGSKTLTIYSQHTVTVQAFAYVTSCDSLVIAKYVPIVYTWQIYFVNGSLVQGMSTSNSSDPTVLRIPRYTLTPGIVYSAVITANSNASIVAVPQSATQTVTVTVQHDKVTANILGPSTQYLILNPSKAVYLTINASLSQDYDRRGVYGQAAGLKYQWNCVLLKPIFNASYCPFAFGRRANLFGNLLQKETVNISAAYDAQVNMTGRLQLTVTSTASIVTGTGGGRSSTAFVDIIVISPEQAVQEGNVVSLALLKGSSMTSFDINQKLVLQADVQLSQLTLCQQASYSQSNYTTVAWTVDDTSILQLNHSSLSPVSYNIRIGQIATFFLSLPSAVLPGDASLTFSLSLLSCGGRMLNGGGMVGNTGISSLIITTNNPPLPGLLLINPATGGIAYSTVFRLDALQWYDTEDMPLLYQFSYESFSLDSLITLRSQSASTSYLSALPPGDVQMFSQLTIVLTVSDMLDAYTIAKQNVSVVLELNNTASLSYLTTLSEDLQELAITDSDGSKVDYIRSTLSLMGGVLSTNNCSTVLNICAGTYHRLPCKNTLHTCGACLPGNIGQEGDANVVCLAVSEAYSAATVAGLTTTSSSATRRLQASSSSNSSSITARFCQINPDCAVNGVLSPWVTCNRREKLCVISDKICPQSCSQHGTCQYHDINSGLPRPSGCLLTDATCTAACVCDEGYYGSSCAYPIDEWTVRQGSNIIALSALYNITQYDDINSGNVQSWAQLLLPLCSMTEPQQMSATAAEQTLHVAQAVLSYYEAGEDAEIDSQIVQQALLAVDNLASVNTFVVLESSSSNGVQQRRSENNTAILSRGLLDVSSRSCRLLQRLHVQGETDVTVLFKNTRCKISSFSLGIQTAYSEITTALNLSAPVTEYEQESVYYQGRSPYGKDDTNYGAVPTMHLTARTSGYGNSSKGNSESILVAVEGGSFSSVLLMLAGHAYRIRRSMNANPVYCHLALITISITSTGNIEEDNKLAVQISNEDERNVMSRIIQQVTWTMPTYNTPLAKFAEDYVTNNFTTVCYGLHNNTELAYRCPDSGAVLQHNCSSQPGPGTFISYCPKPKPSCDYIVPGYATAGGMEELGSLEAPSHYGQPPLCKLQSYSQRGAVCNCSLTRGLANNNSIHVGGVYYYYANDNTNDSTVTSYLLSAQQQSIELALGNAYEPYRYADTFTKKYVPRSIPGPWAIGTIFIPIALLFLLAACSGVMLYYDRQEMKLKYNSFSLKGRRKDYDVTATAAAAPSASWWRLFSVNRKKVQQDNAAMLPEEESMSHRPTTGVGSGRPQSSGTASADTATASTEVFFTEYISILQSLLPSVYDQNISWWSRFTQEMIKHNRLLQALPSYISFLSCIYYISSRFCKIEKREEIHQEDWTVQWKRLSAQIRLLNSSLGMLFTLAALITAQQRHNTGLCYTLTTSTACQDVSSYHTLFDVETAVCSWTLQETNIIILRPTILQPIIPYYACQARPPYQLLTLFSLVCISAVAIAAFAVVGYLSEIALRCFDHRLLRRSGEDYFCTFRLLPVTLQHQLEVLQQYCEERLPVAEYSALQATTLSSNEDSMLLLLEKTKDIQKIDTMMSTRYSRIYSTFLDDISHPTQSLQSARLSLSVDRGILLRGEFLLDLRRRCEEGARAMLNLPIDHNTLHTTAMQASNHVKTMDWAAKLSSGQRKEISTLAEHFISYWSLLSSDTITTLQQTRSKQAEQAVRLLTRRRSDQQGFELLLLFIRDMLGYDTPVAYAWQQTINELYPEVKVVGRKSIQLAIVLLVFSSLSFFLLSLLTGVYLLHRDTQQLLLVIYATLLALYVILLAPCEAVLGGGMPLFSKPIITQPMTVLSSQLLSYGEEAMQRLMILRSGDTVEAERVVYSLHCRSLSAAIAGGRGYGIDAADSFHVSRLILPMIAHQRDPTRLSQRASCGQGLYGLVALLIAGYEPVLLPGTLLVQLLRQERLKSIENVDKIDHLTDSVRVVDVEAQHHDHHQDTQHIQQLAKQQQQQQQQLKEEQSREGEHFFRHTPTVEQSTAPGAYHTLQHSFLSCLIAYNQLSKYCFRRVCQTKSTKSGLGLLLRISSLGTVQRALVTLFITVLLGCFAVLVTSVVDRHERTGYSIALSLLIILCTYFLFAMLHLLIGGISGGSYLTTAEQNLIHGKDDPIALAHDSINTEASIAEEEHRRRRYDHLLDNSSSTIPPAKYLSHLPRSILRLVNQDWRRFVVERQQSALLSLLEDQQQQRLQQEKIGELSMIEETLFDDDSNASDAADSDNDDDREEDSDYEHNKSIQATKHRGRGHADNSSREEASSTKYIDSMKTTTGGDNNYNNHTKGDEDEDDEHKDDHSSKHYQSSYPSSSPSASNLWSGDDDNHSHNSYNTTNTGLTSYGAGSVRYSASGKLLAVMPQLREAPNVSALPTMLTSQPMFPAVRSTSSRFAMQSAGQAQQEATAELKPSSAVMSMIHRSRQFRRRDHSQGQGHSRGHSGGHNSRGHSRGHSHPIIGSRVHTPKQEMILEEASEKSGDSDYDDDEGHEDGDDSENEDEDEDEERSGDDDDEEDHHHDHDSKLNKSPKKFDARSRSSDVEDSVQDNSVQEEEDSSVQDSIMIDSTLTTKPGTADAAAANNNNTAANEVLRLQSTSKSFTNLTNNGSNRSNNDEEVYGSEEGQDGSGSEEQEEESDLESVRK